MVIFRLVTTDSAGMGQKPALCPMMSADRTLAVQISLDPPQAARRLHIPVSGRLPPDEEEDEDHHLLLLSRALWIF